MNEMTPLKAAKILTSSINIQGPVKIVTDELLARATACNYLRRVAFGELAEVVRCHDCKYHGACDTGWPCDITDDNDFCSYGERKNGKAEC